MTEQELLQETTSNGEARANLFPQYLMKLLNDQVASESLWWLPDGLAFCLDPNKITDQVLDKHFQKTKYSSFIRRLHNEGFRRQTRKYKKMEGLKLPEGTVVLSHDLFQKSKPELLESFYKSVPVEKEPSKSSAAIAANNTNIALVQEAKARMEARSKQLVGNSDDMTAAASVLGLKANSNGGAFSPQSLDNYTRSRLGAPKLHAPGGFGAASLEARLQLTESSWCDLRQARMTRELMAAQQHAGSMATMNQFMKTPYAGTFGAGGHNLYHLNRPAGLMGAGQGGKPLSRSSSSESAKERQQKQQLLEQQVQEEANMRNLMLQQQMMQGSMTSFPFSGSAGSGNSFAGVDSQVSQLRQLELETRRRRLQLENEQQQKLSAADALRRFTNTSSSS